ncbi:MAG: OsmC family protein [Gaiellales bacterium]
MSDDRYFSFHAETYTSGRPGRALQRVRSNNFVIDDPARAGYDGPGEAPNAGEYFLSGITGCAALMMERIARADELPLSDVHVSMDADLDTEADHEGPPVFARARMHFAFAGTSEEQAAQLVATFKER